MIKNASNATESHVSGLIFISNQDITSEHKYENPSLIALIDQTNGQKLVDYSFEKLPVQPKKSASDYQITTFMTHEFI